MPDSDKTTTVEEDIYHEYLAESESDALKASPVPEATTVARIDLDELLQGMTSRQDGNTWVYALEGSCGV